MPEMIVGRVPGESPITWARPAPGVLVTDLRSGDNPEGEQTYPYFDEDGELQEMPLTVAQEWAQRVAGSRRIT